MTVEALLLLVLSVFLILGAFSKPGPTFTDHGPKLGARLENHLSSGNDFITNQGARLRWTAPAGAAPQGQFE